MKPLLDAIRALLTPLGYQVHYVDAPDTPTYPYVLLWGSAGIPGPEQSVVGAIDLTDLLGVTSVGATPEAALIAASRVRTVLDGARPVVAGQLVWLTLAGSQPVQVDRSLTMPSTDRHPAYAVDQYRLVAVPA